MSGISRVSNYSTVIPRQKTPLRGSLSEDEELSWKLSEVLEDVGITREIVRTRQCLGKQRENLFTLLARLEERSVVEYTVGSVMDGSLTSCPEATVDYNICHKGIPVVETPEQGSGDDGFLLHIMDDTPPGYVCLKPLNEFGAPVSTIPEKYKSVYDMVGDVVLLNHNRLLIKSSTGETHGPALLVSDDNTHINKKIVQSFYVPNWPDETVYWVERTETSKWPPRQVRKEMMESGCLLVPAGHKQSDNKNTEFRVSFEIAEKILSKSLNITQVRSLHLLKVIAQTHVNIEGESPLLTNYHCKTALFHTVEKDFQEAWRPTDLLTWTMKSLKWLKRCVARRKLPHYLMPGVNLWEGRLDNDKDRDRIAQAISTVLDDPLKAIRKITIADIGTRLQDKDKNKHIDLPKASNIRHEALSNFIQNHMFAFLKKCNKVVYGDLRKNDIDYNLQTIRNTIGLCKKIEKEDASMKHALTAMMPILYSVYGCLLGAQSTDEETLGPTKSKTQREKALQYLQLGQNSDLTSGMLRTASALYIARKYALAEELLTNIERRYNTEYLLKVCGCRTVVPYPSERGFIEGCFSSIEQNTLHEQCSFCVVFTHPETPCVPEIFHREMERSSERELKRREPEDYWMDWASMDSLPFLHLLQYLNYTALEYVEEKNKSLNMLRQVAKYEPLYHKETVLNVLGQCYELEKKWDQAFQCYEESIEIMPANNAALKLRKDLKTTIEAQTDDT